MMKNANKNVLIIRNLLKITVQNGEKQTFYRYEPIKRGSGYFLGSRKGDIKVVLLTIIL